MKTLTKFLLLNIFLLMCFTTPNFKKSSIVKLPPQEIKNKELYYGIDVSHYQNKIKWEQVDDTLEFVICKKTEGLTINDKTFHYNFNNAPFKKGAYHFFIPHDDGVLQAKHFLRNLDTCAMNIRPVIDLEWSRGWKGVKNNKRGVKNLQKMITHLKQNCGRPIIYTSYSFWKYHLEEHLCENDYTLWVADYKNTDCPIIPSCFDDWIIWQKSQNHRVKGIRGYVDLNVCKNMDSIMMKK